MLDKAKVLEWANVRPTTNSSHHNGYRACLDDFLADLDGGRFDAPLTEEVRQLRDAATIFKDRLEESGKLYYEMQMRAIKAEQERNKLVKALERIAHGERSGLEDVYANYILSEIKGTET